MDNSLKLAHCDFRRRIEVVTEYGEIPEVECEPRQLGQVFLNLLVNAGQAITGEGTVSIKTEREGEFVHVSISDTGCGIAPEHRDRIFSSRFTTKAPGIGTGLGLAISRDIVEGAHGGTIDFESEVGTGTTFHVRLPLSQGSGADQT
jgi:signal transduction histidine kinase